MFAKVSEQTMHRVRWAIASGWLLLIFSLFYDPISPWFTQPHNQLSPLRLHPDICVQVQGVCLEQKPYPLGAAIFWGAIIPLAIFILSVFGHELWRRICPLSFLSQIPRSLSWQRQHRRVNKKTGKVRYELAKVPKNSWLARNHPYLQFGLLYLGICSRILFVNSNRLILGLFLISTILAAIAVGYFYGGKSWCQYFCPMASVQKIYGEPRGLLNSKAHEDHSQTITQSMCRIVKSDGKEQSACVACQSPCIDIDAERSYWDGITKPEQRWLYYGYVGLVIGYACYYYLYAGNWDYYFSGAWTHQENQLATLLSPGFYLFDRPIGLPKLLAVPLTLGMFIIGAYFLGRKLEKLYKTYLLKQQQHLSQEQIQHRIFTICTFFVFNLFFIFGGRPFILLLSLPWQYLYNLAIAILSTLWLYRTWGRNENLYTRESIASRLRKQLSKLQLDVSRFLEGRSLEDLSADEVYVLAKVVPGFTKEKRLQAYKEVVRDTLQQGYFSAADSLEKLQYMRQELDIGEKEHQSVLGELATEEPKLFNSNQQNNRENWLRLESYRESLETMLNSWWQQSPATGLAADLFDVVAGKKSIESISELFDSFVEDNSQAIQSNRREYAITAEEEAQILKNLEKKRQQINPEQLQEQQKLNQTDGSDYIKQLQAEAEKFMSDDDW